MRSGRGSCNNKLKKIFIVYGKPDAEVLRELKCSIIVSNSYKRLERIRENLDRSLIFYGKKRVCLKGDGNCSGCIHKPRSNKDYAKLSGYADKYLKGETPEDLCPFHLQRCAVRYASFVLTTPALLRFLSDVEGVKKRFRRLIIDNSADLFFPSSRTIKTLRRIGNEWVEENVVKNAKTLNFEINTLDDAVLLVKLLLLTCEHARNRIPHILVKNNSKNDIEVLEFIRNSINDLYQGALNYDKWCEYLRDFHQFLHYEINYNNCNIDNLVNAVLFIAYTGAAECIEIFRELDEEVRREVIEKIAQMEIEKEIIELCKAILFPLGVLQCRTHRFEHVYLIADEWYPIYKIPEHFSEIYIFTNPFSDKALRLAEYIIEETETKGMKADLKVLAKENDLKIVIPFNLSKKNLVNLLRRLSKEGVQTAVLTTSKREQIKMSNVLDSYKINFTVLRGHDVSDVSSPICIALPDFGLSSDIAIVPRIDFIHPFYQFMFHFAEESKNNKAAEFFARKIKECRLELLLKMSGSKVLIADHRTAKELSEALKSSGCRVVTLSSSNVDSLAETINTIIKFSSQNEERLKLNYQLSLSSFGDNVNSKEYNTIYFTLHDLVSTPIDKITIKPFSHRVEHYLHLAEEKVKLESSKSKENGSKAFICEKIAINLASLFGSSKTISHSSLVKRIKDKLKINDKAEIDAAIRHLIDSGRLRKFKRGRRVYYEYITKEVKSEPLISKLEQF